MHVCLGGRARLHIASGGRWLSFVSTEKDGGAETRRTVPLVVNARSFGVATEVCRGGYGSVRRYTASRGYGRPLGEGCRVGALLFRAVV